MTPMTPMTPPPPEAGSLMGLRLVARVVDLLVVGVVFVAVLLGVASVVSDGNAGTAGRIVLAVVLLGLVAAAAAYEVVLIACWGATLGKRMVRVEVVLEGTDQHPGWVPSLVRWLVPVLGFLVCGIGQYVVYLSPFFDGSGRERGWHDQASRTQVVRVLADLPGGPS
ncbi:hypothetical protein GCM10023145_22200 [Angustibacter luteus]